MKREPPCLSDQAIATTVQRLVTVYGYEAEERAIARLCEAVIAKDVTSVAKWSRVLEILRDRNEDCDD